MGLLVGFLEDPVFLLIHPFLLLFQFLFQRFDFLLVLGNLQLFLLDGLAADLQVGQQIFEALIRLGEMDFGFLDDGIGQSQLAGNGESITLARDADEQPVGGPQGFHVKFAAGVFYLWCGQGEHLQLTVVGGGHGADTLAVEPGQDGDGQRCALVGVGAGGQLVEEHQGIAVRFFQNIDNLRHVGRERT